MEAGSVSQAQCLVNTSGLVPKEAGWWEQVATARYLQPVDSEGY